MSTINDAALIGRLLDVFAEARHIHDLDMENVRQRTGLDVKPDLGEPGEYLASTQLHSGQRLLLTSSDSNSNDLPRQVMLSLNPDTAPDCPLRQGLVHERLLNAGFSAQWMGGREGSTQSWRYTRGDQTIRAGMPSAANENTRDACVFHLILDMNR